MTSEQRKLKALEAMYLALSSPIIETDLGNLECLFCAGDEIKNGFKHEVGCPWLQLEQFNITADESEPDE